MRIGLDCDGVLANFNHAYGDLLVKLCKRDTLPKDWKGDPSFPDIWDWDVKHGYKEDLKEVWKYIADDRHSFWNTLKCMLTPDVRHDIMNLSWGAEHMVYYITNRPGKGAKLQTETWLRGCGISDCPTVLIAEDKPPIIKSLGLDFYIDDRLKTMIDLENFYYKSGIDTKDKHFYLLDAPYNRADRPSTLKVASSVREALQKAGLSK